MHDNLLETSHINLPYHTTSINSRRLKTESSRNRNVKNKGSKKYRDVLVRAAGSVSKWIRVRGGGRHAATHHVSRGWEVLPETLQHQPITRVTDQRSKVPSITNINIPRSTINTKSNEGILRKSEKSHKTSSKNFHQHLTFKVQVSHSKINCTKTQLS